MNRQIVPDGEELARLIHAAFEALPGPDAERLAAIEARLTGQLRQPRRRRGIGWGWLLLLAGTAATAAWWAGETWWPAADESQPEQAMPAPAEPAAEEKEHVPSRRADAGEESARPSPSEQQSPVIYKREGY